MGRCGQLLRTETGGRRALAANRMEVCPTEVVLAPAERIWSLLTDSRRLAQWTGTTVVRAPAHSLRVGDRLAFRVGVFRITFDVLDMRPLRQLTLDISLPLGVMNHEEIHITPIDARASRVTFN